MKTHRLILSFGFASTLLIACSPVGLGPGGDGGAPQPDLTTASDLATRSCAGLDENTCRATPGCVAATCVECACTPLFAGCIAVGEPMPSCPQTNCPLERQCCRAESDCNGNGECVPSGVSQCGGACMIPMPCQQDGDCPNSQGPPMICTQPDCNCNGVALACEPGCIADADCHEGQTCAPNHHCVATTCAHDADCLPDFHCAITPGGAGCQRRSCTVDADCPSSFCVEGACYTALGSCQFAQP